MDDFFGIESRHIVLKGYSVLEITADSVKLDRTAPAPFDSDEIPVTIGVIATGSEYAQPMRPSSIKLDEAVATLRTMQQDIAKAKAVVVVGGGPVGVEFTGEVMSQHPDKKVTLIQQADRLVPGWRQPLHDKLVAQLTAKKVDVRLNTRVEVRSEMIQSSNRLLEQPISLTLSDGAQLETDFLFISTGGQPNVSAVPEGALEDPLPDAKGSPHRRVAVDQGSLRVRYEPLKPHWFCLGDACNTADSKTNIAATAHAPIVAGQIVAQTTGSKKTLKLHTSAPNIMVVPFGPSGGAAQLFFLVLGEWVTSLFKGKSLLIHLFKPVYPGGQPLKQ